MLIEIYCIMLKIGEYLHDRVGVSIHRLSSLYLGIYIKY